MANAMVNELMPLATLLISQTALPRERLQRAGKLKAVFNVDGNFLPNVAYDISSSLPGSPARTRASSARASSA